MSTKIGISKKGEHSTACWRTRPPAVGVTWCATHRRDALLRLEHAGVDECSSVLQPFRLLQRGRLLARCQLLVRVEPASVAPRSVHRVPVPRLVQVLLQPGHVGVRGQLKNRFNSSDVGRYSMLYRATDKRRSRFSHEN